MISKGFIKIFGFLINFCYYTLTFPFKWNKSKHRLEPSHRFAITYWYGLCFINVSWRVIASIIMIYNVISFKIIDSRLILCVTCVCTLLISVVVHYSLLTNIYDWKDIMAFTNDLFRFDQRIVKMYKKNFLGKSPSPQSSLDLEYFIKTLVLMFTICQSVSIPILYILLTHQPEIFHFIRQDWVLWNLTLAILGHASLFCDIVICILMLTTNLCHLKLLHYSLEQFSWTSHPEARKYTKTIKSLYRELQVLHAQSMKLLRPIFPPLSILVVTFTIALIFSTIRFISSTHNIFLCLWTFLFSTTMFYFLEHFIRSCYEIIKDCQNFRRWFYVVSKTKRRRVDVKFLKSCRNIEVGVGNLFVVSRATFMNIVGIIVLPNVINLLITLE